MWKTTEIELIVYLLALLFYSFPFGIMVIFKFGNIFSMFSFENALFWNISIAVLLLM